LTFILRCTCSVFHEVAKIAPLNCSQLQQRLLLSNWRANSTSVLFQFTNL